MSRAQAFKSGLDEPHKVVHAKKLELSLQVVLP